MIDYEGSVYLLARDLKDWYPAWEFGVCDLHSGLGIDAHLPETSKLGGLYAVVSDSLEEIRRELDAARLSTAS